MARERVPQRTALRRLPDGDIEQVWIRKCSNCRCWFGTPWYRDKWCCQACKDAMERRDKETRKKVWPKARVVKEIDR